VAERYVASGLVAVAFSTLVFMVPLGSRLVYKTRVHARVALGALVGVAGIASLFLPELRAATAGGATALGVAFALGSTVIAAIGNLVTVRLQRERVPVMSGTAWGMGYGAVTAAGVAWVEGSAWSFDWGAKYVGSLVYLAVFGSIVAFGAYFKLIQRIGADRASFTAVVIPVVAMVLSTVFESYQWTWRQPSERHLRSQGTISRSPPAVGCDSGRRQVRSRREAVGAIADRTSPAQAFEAPTPIRPSAANRYERSSSRLPATPAGTAPSCPG
jgi:hypothetical protein